MLYMSYQLSIDRSRELCKTSQPYELVMSSGGAGFAPTKQTLLKATLTAPPKDHLSLISRLMLTFSQSLFSIAVAQSY